VAFKNGAERGVANMSVQSLKSDVAWGADASIQCPVNWGWLGVASDFIELGYTLKERCWSQIAIWVLLRSPVQKFWSHYGRFAHVTCVRGL
jgi:hypothetical protein